MNGLMGALCRPDTVQVQGSFADAVRELKAMPISPLSRLKRLRVSPDVFDAMRRPDAKASAPRMDDVEVVCHPFVPRGYALGFSARDELLFVINTGE